MALKAKNIWVCFGFIFFLFAVKSLGEKGKRESSYIGKLVTSLDN